MSAAERPVRLRQTYAAVDDLNGGLAQRTCICCSRQHARLQCPTPPATLQTQPAACAQVNGKKLPWSAAVKPTEWLLGPTRRLIPPVGGVDISPIIWFAFLSFTNEILVGPQVRPKMLWSLQSIGRAQTVIMPTRMCSTRRHAAYWAVDDYPSC
jgi:YGGT family